LKYGREIEGEVLEMSQNFVEHDVYVEVSDVCVRNQAEGRQNPHELVKYEVVVLIVGSTFPVA
jgi:hypothetical protein